MSIRRTRATRITNDELKELVMKLQVLMPESSSRHTTREVSNNYMRGPLKANSTISAKRTQGLRENVPASKILKETCNYIKRLHREVDNLSDKLSHLLNSMENNSVDLDILRSLLQR